MSTENTKQIKRSEFKPEDVADEYSSFEKRGRRFVISDGESVDHIHNAEAMAVWIYLRNKPDNWIPNRFQVMRCFGMGERKYKDIIAFLVRCNLASHLREKDELGKFGGSRLIMEDGSNFIPQCTHKNCHRKKDDKDESPTVQESCIVDKPQEIRGVIHSAENPHCGKLHPLINNNININKKTTTTTMDIDLDRRDHGQPKEKKVSSSSSFDISSLKPYGFTDDIADQLACLGRDPVKVQEAIDNFALMLKDPVRSSTIKSPVGYFMSVMRQGGRIDAPVVKATPAGHEARQAQIKKTMTEGDGRYDDLLKESVKKPEVKSFLERVTSKPIQECDLDGLVCV